MISIGVIDRDIFSPGCNVDTLCLGEWSLGLEINNQMIYSPGEYKLANNGGRVVMHITYMVRAFESGMILTTILPQRDVYSQVVYKILQWACCWRIRVKCSTLSCARAGWRNAPRTGTYSPKVAIGLPSTSRRQSLVCIWSIAKAMVNAAPTWLTLGSRRFLHNSLTGSGKESWAKHAILNIIGRVAFPMTVKLCRLERKMIITRLMVNLELIL